MNSSSNQHSQSFSDLELVSDRIIFKLKRDLFPTLSSNSSKNDINNNRNNNKEIILSELTKIQMEIDDERFPISLKLKIAKSLIERVVCDPQGGGEQNVSLFSSSSSMAEQRHFGYTIIQKAMVKPSNFQDEKDKEELMAIIQRELELSARSGYQEPWPVKSKVAQITAEFIKREGSLVWIEFAKAIRRMLKSECAFEQELAAIITRYVAEDVALHSEEVFADKVRDLLSGMTSTIDEITRALFEALERNFRVENMFFEQNYNQQMARQHSNATIAILETVSVYAEWAPLVPFVRSGLVDSCAALLINEKYRNLAGNVIKLFLSRKSLPEDVPEEDRRIFSLAVSTCVRSVTVSLDLVLNQQYSVENSDIFEQFSELACQAGAVQVLTSLFNEHERVALLERLAALVRIPNLKSLEMILGTWASLLRANGAVIPSSLKKFQVKNKIEKDAISLKMLPNGAVAALLDYCMVWLRNGGGLASGMDPKNASLQAERDQWEECFETFEEMKTQWVVVRAKIMEVVKLCSNLEPEIAAEKLLDNINGAFSWLQSLEESSTSDEARACILEGVQSYTECVMLVLPIENIGAHDTVIEIEKLIMMTMGMMHGLQSLAQHAKILESFSRIGIVRPNLVPLIIKHLFEMLNAIATDDVGAHPARGKARGLKLSQIVRQKICSAMLNICTTIPEALNPHLEPLAEQIESLRAKGALTGSERGTLAEALLAVATPSGPVRIRQVVDWLLSPVKNRWFSPESLSALPTVSNLFSPETFVSGPIDTLSNLHWDIFHDVQLLERCYRRSADAYSQLDVVENKEISSQECLISDHCEWSLLLSTELQKSVRSIFTPAFSEKMRSVGLSQSLDPSWEELTAGLKPGMLKEFAINEAENQNLNAPKIVSVRDWLNVIRDASLNIVNLLFVHAAQQTYPNTSIAEKMENMIASDLEYQRDDQVRTMTLLFIRPVLSRCPLQFRQIWFRALVAPILSDLCRRVDRGWSSKHNEIIDFQLLAMKKNQSSTTNDDSEASTRLTTAVIESFSERTLREISRELGSILELIVAPDGTLGRKTKCGAITRPAGAVSSKTILLQGTSSPSSEKDAIAGGKHLIDWMCSQSNVSTAQQAIQAATHALRIDDLECVSKAILFCRGLCAAASVSDQRIGSGLAESCGGEILLAAVTALAKSTNSSLQPDLLGLIYEFLSKHARTSKSVTHAMLCIPGITGASLQNTLDEMSKCSNSYKKAILHVKTLFVNLEGGKSILQNNFASKDGKSAIQVPTPNKRRRTSTNTSEEAIKYELDMN